MSTNWQQDVREFHEKFGAPVLDKPTIMPVERQALRFALILEEFKEVERALAEDDLVGLADGLADLIYVVLGTAVESGINLQPIWDAVHASNMTKERGSVREDGKILKPEGWQPPDIRALLIEQGAEL